MQKKERNRTVSVFVVIIFTLHTYHIEQTKIYLFIYFIYLFSILLHVPCTTKSRIVLLCLPAFGIRVRS